MRFYFKAIDEMTGREAFYVERLRNGVFASERKIVVPEVDGEDFYVIHVFILNKSNDNTLATCRIFKGESGAWYLGRVVVSKKARGVHLGSKVLEEVHYYLRENGADRLYYHAQMIAKPFHGHLGCQVKGDIFNGAGIGHILTYRNL